MTTLHFQLLGEFRLTDGDTSVVTVNSPRLQSLLAYLLLHAGTPQRRQHIAFLLWPDSSEARARNSLRNLLHQLRHALPAAEAFIESDDEEIVWHSEASYTLDVAAFNDAIAQSQSSDEGSAQLALEKAVALYQDDLFPACYDDWIIPLRTRLRLSYTAALSQLIQLYMVRKEYTRALQTAEQWRQYDPLQETVYLHLLQIAGASGDYVRAHRIYQEAVDLLQRELGLAPGAELRSAYLALKNKSSVPSASHVQNSLTNDVPGIVGRVREMTDIQQHWRTLQPGHPQVILLSGEPGIGKSRLAQAFMAWLAEQHSPAISAHCYAGEGSLAYAPLVEWLRTPLVTKAIGSLDKLWQSELLRLLPELRNHRPPPPSPAPLHEAWQRHHFFEALAHTLFALPQPHLLFLDDWQWCDWETLEWLNFFLRSATHHALFILGTIRREEVSQNQRLQTLLLSWQQLGWLTEIRLGPLDEVETATLANQIAGYELPPAQAQRLAYETEGNPLFVVETIRAQPTNFETAIEAAEDNVRPIGAVRFSAELPAKVQAVIEYRLAQLSPLALALASVAAVIGRRFMFELLVAASGQPEEEALHGLDELCQRRLVQEVEGGIFDFSHDKVREVAYTQLSVTRRQFLHRKVGQTLTQLVTADQAAINTQAACHFEQANSLDQAVRYYIQAATAAADLHAYHRAAQLYARAAQIAGKLNLPSPMLIQIYLEQGRMLEHTGEFVAATQVYHQLEALAYRRADKNMEATAVAHLATVYSGPTHAHDLQQAQTMSVRGVTLAQQLGDHDLAARLLWSQMVTASHYGEDRAAQAAGEASLTLCRQYQLDQRLPYVLNDLAINLRLSGRQAEGQRHAEEARACFHAQNDLPMLADNLAQQAWSDYHQLRFADALHWAQECITLCRKIENGWNLSLALATRGLVKIRLGVWGDALNDLAESIRIGKAAGFAIAVTSIPVCLGALLRTLGASEQANALHQEAYTAAQQQAPFTLTAIETQLAQDAFALGQNEEGSCWLQAAFAHQPQGAISRAWVTLADLPLASVAAAQATGDWTHAVYWVAQTLAEAQQRHLPVYWPQLQIAQAQGYLAIGHLDQAESTLQAALALAESHQLIPVLWQAHSMLATLYKQQQRPQASQHRQEAIAHLRTLAAALPDPHLRHTFLTTAAVQATLIL
ncbi:MAG: AAA family ATPase [Caldilineaceae bacterium]